MPDLSMLFARIDGYTQDVVSLQGELTSRIAMGPTNGGTGEHEKVEYILELLKALEPDSIELVKAPDPNAYQGYRPNLIAKWDGRETHPTVWVLSHSDVVPPGDLSLWDSDPFEIQVEGDRIVGRGVEDNQHGFVSSFLALKAILESGQDLIRSVGLIVVADEETGSRYGLEYLLKNRRNDFRNEDLIIVPDAGNASGTMVEVAEKSMLWLKFCVTGHQCHASTPEKGKNSLIGAAELIMALKNIQNLFNESDSLFSPPCSTFAPTKIEGNVPNVNTIPGKDIFYMDCRVLPQYRLDDVIREAEDIAREVSVRSGLEISVTAFHRQDAAEPTSPHAPVVRALQDAILRVRGKKAFPMGIGGGTVAALFRQAGLPAAVWCSSPDTAHQPNEYCLISDILSDAKVFAAVYQD
jgi:succinyl-diaminopimelate desuccinylase